MILNGLSIAIFNVLNEYNLYNAITVCLRNEYGFFQKNFSKTYGFFKKKTYINVEMFGKVRKKIDILFLATVDDYSLEK